MKPTTSPGRVVIPCYCWIRQPGEERRCTLTPGHSGDHFHAYTRAVWPRRPGEQQ